MQLDRKGSKSEGVLGIQKAAKELQVSVRTVQNMVKSGLLSPVFIKDKKTGHNRMCFNQNEVWAVTANRLEKGSTAKTGNVAARALALAQHTHKQLESVLLLLGITEEALSFGEEDVAALYEKAREFLKYGGISSEGDAVFWARVFMQTSEEYLRLLEHHDQRPWILLLGVGEKIAKELRDNTSLTIDKTLGFLNAARRHLRNTAYCFVRAKEGYKGVASNGVDYQRLDEEIIRLMALT